MENDTEKSTLLQKVCTKTCDIMDGTMEILASWQIGQSILKQTDRCLWVFEKSAEWSIPVPDTPTNKQPDTNGTFGKPGPLIRPLPWVLFLPMLLFLRILRMSLNFGAVFMGMDYMKPTTIVKFLQTKRRRVRALKFRGLRRMVHRKPSSPTDNEEVTSWRSKLYKSLAGAMCINYKHNDTSERIIARENSSEALIPVNTEHKRKFDDIESEYADEESLTEIINKLAEEDSDEDPEYIPSDLESDNESVSGDDDEPVSTAKPILKRPDSHNSITNEVIEEENEDSDSSTVSVDSTVEANKNKEADKPKSPIKETELPANNKIEQKNNILDHQIDSVTSDEYFSPQNSNCASPEPRKEVPNTNITKKDLSEQKTIDDPKISSEQLITTEKTQGKANLDANSTPSNNYRGHGKKMKNRRKFSNILHRKRK